MILNLLYVFILVLAFPVGYLLAWLAKDELVAGRKWFIILVIVSLVVNILLVCFLFVSLPITLTLFFIDILCLMALWKSYDKKWVGKKK